MCYYEVEDDCDVKYLYKILLTDDDFVFLSVLTQF